MARLEGKTVDPLGRYEAVELWGGGVVRLVKTGVSQPPREGFSKVQISLETLARIGRKKLKDETLAQAVERFAILGLLQDS
jgi:hypothetical protein